MKLLYRKFVLPLCGFSLLLLSGCSWLQSEDVDETANWSASRFLTEAKQAIADGSYTTGIELLEKLQARYPFGRFSQQAQLETIYAHYKDNEADLAVTAADRFIRIHPRHPFVDYAYYLKGLANFDRGIGILDRLFPSDPSKTDTFSAQQSFNDFAELIQKFPESNYAEDARLRMLYLRNNLATYEINVADYYMRRKAYVAAANRGKFVLENYSSTPAVADALVIMTKAYTRLELSALAEDSLRVLQLNYPDSQQLKDFQLWQQGKEADEGFSLFGLLNF